MSEWLCKTSNARNWACLIGHSYILPNVCVGEVVGDGVVLAVILELLGRDGGAKEVLQVLEDVLLGRRKGARLRLGVELV